MRESPAATAQNFALRLASVDALFHELDARPVAERELRDEVHDQLLDQWERVRATRPTALTLIAPAAERDASDEEAVRAAIRRDLRMACGPLRQAEAALTPRPGHAVGRHLRPRLLHRARHGARAPDGQRGDRGNRAGHHPRRVGRALGAGGTLLHGGRSARLEPPALPGVRGPRGALRVGLRSVGGASLRLRGGDLVGPTARLGDQRSLSSER